MNKSFLYTKPRGNSAQIFSDPRALFTSKPLAVQDKTVEKAEATMDAVNSQKAISKI